MSQIYVRYTRWCTRHVCCIGMAAAPQRGAPCTIRTNTAIKMTTALESVVMLNQSIVCEEDMGQLMKRYFSLRQKDGEELSEFLLRIGAVLREMRKGDRIKATEVEVYFCDQFLRGAIPDHPVVVKMRCSWMRGDPLSWRRLGEQAQ
ncbi:hypothetical protein FKM82_025588 [Ascaphus truei]